MGPMSLPIRTMDVSTESLHAYRRNRARPRVVPQTTPREPDAPVRVRRNRSCTYPRAVAKPVPVDFRPELEEEIHSMLSEHLDARRIEVQVRGSRVQLRGVVNSELDLQIAEDIAWLLPEIRHCTNSLRVRRLSRLRASA